MNDAAKKNREAFMRYSFILLVGLFCLASSQSTKADGQTDTNTELETVLQKEAVAGDANAQYSLGFMYANGWGSPYANGKGVPKDTWEAVKWYRRAAEQGHVLAQYELGAMYEVGRGAPVNAWEAMKWYRKAAEQGYTLAQANLGVMYKFGDGVPQDLVEAYAWINIAADLGIKMAIEPRDFLEKIMGRDSLEKAQERSREYCEKYVVPFW